MTLTSGPVSTEAPSLLSFIGCQWFDPSKRHILYTHTVRRRKNCGVVQDLHSVHKRTPLGTRLNQKDTLRVLNLYN